jgi:hypothetical protein
LWRNPESIGRFKRPRDCRQGIRALGEDAGPGTYCQGWMELRMARTNIAERGDGIADGAQELIESYGGRGRLHGDGLCGRSGLLD